MSQVQRAERLTERVARGIRDALLDREWQLGDRLPSEKLLAERFEVSRNVVREALKGLETVGLIEIRRGAAGGAFVRQASARLLNDALYTVLRLEGFELRHLHQARLLLEPPVAALAAEQAKPLQLAELERGIDRARVAASRGEPMGTAVELHQQLARMTGNPILQLLVGLVSDLLETSRTLHPSPIDRFPEAAQQLVRDHQRIVEAVGSHNPARAREAMRQHLENISIVEQGAL